MGSARPNGTQLLRIAAIVAAMAMSACGREPVPSTGKAPEPGALWFGGDVHFGVSARSGLGDIAPSLAGAVGIVNLEGPISMEAGGAHVRDGVVTLQNPHETPTHLLNLGIQVATTANNHRGDDALAGTLNTPFALGEAGIADADRVHGLVVGASEINLFAYDLRDQQSAAQLAAALDRISRGINVIALHVTGPASYLPRPELVAAVDAAVAHGADIVVAHGTHVIGPVERRGNTVIAWGLGNLFFDCECTTEDEALILRVSLAPGHPAEIIPIRAGLFGRDAGLHEAPAAVFDLLDALNSSPLTRSSRSATF